MQQHRREDRRDTGIISAAGITKLRRTRTMAQARHRTQKIAASLWGRGVLVVCVMALVACSGTESDFESIESPDGKFTLIVTVTEPGLPHTLHKVTAYVEAQGSGVRQMLMESPLANDGVPFTARNIGVRWTSATTALVCLRPTDLPDNGIRIDVSGTPSAIIEPGC